MKNIPIYDRIEREIYKRKEEQLFRSIPEFCDDKNLIDYSTNSYLSLHDNREVAVNARKLCDGNLTGNCSSRLISQKSPLYAELETEIASWEKTESSLVFNSGYAANLGIIGSLCKKDTAVFCDRLNHASIYDGITLSGSRLIRYHHNDMADLLKQIRSSDSKEKLIITDSVFSMDGDRAPLAAICEIAEQYGCMVMIDEAHATGIFGSYGSGLAEEAGVTDRIDIRMGTLSKAITGLGGYFAGSKLLRDFFINNGRSLVYSTGLPHAVLAHNIASIRYIRKNPHLGRKLLETAAKFRNNLQRAGFDTMNSSTQIVPCKLGSAASALNLSAFLRTHGIIAPAVRPPTVPPQTARIRFSIFSGLDKWQLERTMEKISEWKKKNG
jgi:8-amino-7-oxononanoate synthase